MKHNYSSSLRRTLSAVVLLLCVSTLSWAADFKAGGIYYNIKEDGESVEVTYHSVRLYSGDIVIPSTVKYERKTYIVTSIGDYAFDDCTSLASINIPSSVTSIEDYAFRDCSSLTFIDIPSSVTSIGDYAFGDCTSIISVICRAEEVPVCDYGVFDGTPIDKATVYVPASSINAYRAADGWKDFGTILSLEEYETGIDAPSALQPDDVADAAAPYYTIGGQRVNAPVRGHIYIRSGRKVIY